MVASDGPRAEAFVGAYAEVHEMISARSSPYDLEVERFTSRLEDNQHAPSLDEFLIPLVDVANAIRNLRSGKVPGWDKIVPNMLRFASRKIGLQLYYIFRHAINSSYFPRPWKIARETPVAKPGNLRTMSPAIDLSAYCL